MTSTHSMTAHAHVLVSVIMPAYNAASSITQALQSLKQQRFASSAIEILVIDGGSTDETRAIANAFDATVIDNPHRQQEYAKHLGLRHARGRYAIFMDADEVLLNPDALQKRITFFEHHPEVRNIICSGLLTPPGFPRICDYINALGDPFYYFISRIDSSQYVSSLTKRYPNVALDDQRVIVHFNRNDVLPVIDSGTHMFDLAYFKTHFSDAIRTPDCVPLVFETMARRTHCLGMLRDDFIHHYSVSSVCGYLRKLNWKIIANIHYPRLPGVGYGNRAQLSRRLRRRSFGFVLYGVSVFLPLYDAAALAIRKRNPIFLLHGYFCGITLLLIAFHQFLKVLGIHPNLPVYGK